MKLYAEITKTEDVEDGTIKVFGYASSGAVDSDGETITPDAMKAALPDYLKWGAVREMHQPKAAGTALEARVEDDGRTYFAAHVVDTEAVKKVKTGVYKGFSIGGKVTARDDLNKTTITGLKLVEVSLVDRPANPEAVMTCFKAEGIEEDQDAGQKSPNIAKSMYSVSDFANVLRSISYLAGDAEAEAQWEGDASPVPAQLRDWLAQGVSIFQSMAQEEAQEMLTQLSATAKAARDGNLAKAGAKFSTTTKAALKAAHDACKAADKALADLGYDADEATDDSGSEKSELAQSAGQANTGAVPADAEADDTNKSDTSNDLTKALDATRSDLAKAKKERDDAIKKAEEQAKRIAELEAKPEPPKGSLKAFGKAEDTAAGETTETPASPRDAIRKAHQTGGFRLA